MNSSLCLMHDDEKKQKYKQAKKGVKPMKKSIVFLTAFATLFFAGVSTSVLAGDAQPAEATVAAEEAQPTLFEQLGGHDAVKAAVDGFYVKVLADERVNGFFEGVDMDRQRAMQISFLTFAFGGPNNYEGKDLRTAHAHLVAKGLNDTHYDIIVEHLGATLKELGVKDELIQQAANVANSVRNDVLGK